MSPYKVTGSPSKSCILLQTAHHTLQALIISTDKTTVRESLECLQVLVNKLLA